MGNWMWLLAARTPPLLDRGWERLPTSALARDVCKLQRLDP